MLPGRPAIFSRGFMPDEACGRSAADHLYGDRLAQFFDHLFRLASGCFKDAENDGPRSDISPTLREIAPWMGHAPMAVIEGSCGLHTGLRAFWKNTPSCRAALTGKAHSGVDAPPARSIDLPRTVGVHPRSPWGAASHGGYGCLLQLGRLRVHRLPFGSPCTVPDGTPQAPNCSCGLIT